MENCSIENRCNFKQPISMTFYHNHHGKHAFMTWDNLLVQLNCKHNTTRYTLISLHQSFNCLSHSDSWFAIRNSLGIIGDVNSPSTTSIMPVPLIYFNASIVWRYAKEIFAHTLFVRCFAYNSNCFLVRISLKKEELFRSEHVLAFSYFS